MISILPQRLKTGVLLLLLLIGGFAFGQTAIFTYAGGGSQPPGWSFQNNVTANPIDKSSYWLVDAGSPSDIITTATYDLSAYTDGEFALQVASFGNGAYNRAKIEISFDGGLNYTQTETSAITTGSSYEAEDAFALNSVSSQVVIRISNNASSGRGVRLKNLKLTASGEGGNTGPNIANITQDPTSVAPSETVMVSADITDADGVASAELRWGLTSGSLSTTIPMTLDTGTTYKLATAIPAQANGTTVYYEIEATDANGTPLTTTSAEQSYTVADPAVFNIPYYNALGNSTNFDDAEAIGFVFTNAYQSGSYVRIDNGSIVSPAINFSAYNELTVSFDLGTYGGNGGELSVSVSNDNGANYTLLGTFTPTSSTLSTYEQIIDLTSLNGTNGRIKFVEPSGSNSVRFNELNIVDSGGGNAGPEITNITQNPGSNAVTSSNTVSVSADITDVDGVASATLFYGTVSGSLGSQINMTLSSGTTYTSVSSIPAQVGGTTVYYEIRATDGNLPSASTTSAEQSYTVTSSVEFNLPYFNGFRTLIDYNAAETLGFEYDNTVHATGGDGYVRIYPNGSITTPAIDFSNYANLNVIFDTEDFGGILGQELTVSVSNDDGVNYTPLTTIVVPADYETYSQIIDLSTLNGTNGRIKFEMTAGGGSTRFRDLTIEEYDGFLYLNEAWTPSDPNINSTAADDVYVSNGTAVFTANIATRNITVNTGATLEIEKVLTIAGNIKNNGNLVFVSTATGNGELGEVQFGSTITGNATVQRYMQNKRSYRMVSPAVTTTTTIHANWQEGGASPAGFGTHITGSTTGQNGFDATQTGAPSMYYVPDGSQAFAAIGNTNVNTLTAGSPYLMMVRGDRNIDLTDNNAHGLTTLRATGKLVTGSQTQNFTSVAEDFVMFGNPYQSAVNIVSVFANSTNLNTNFVYLYDPNNATHGGYETVDLSEVSPNQYLQPGQAAQVKVTGAATIRFNESDKAPGNFTTMMRNTTSGSDRLTVQLYTTENFNNEGPLHDSFIIRFAEGNDNELTPTDAVKPMNFYENLGIDNNGTYLSIERREMPQPAEVYAMYSAGYQYADYTMKLSVDGLDATFLYLDDQFTGESTLLEAGDNTYGFAVNANEPLSKATDRFSIRTEARLGVENNSLLAGIRLFPNPLKDDMFYINAPKLNGEQLNVNISDLSGRMIYEATLDCRANTVTVPMNSSMASGIYLVTLNHGGEAQTYRLIKE